VELNGMLSGCQFLPVSPEAPLACRNTERLQAESSEGDLFFVFWKVGGYHFEIEL
jgi:hypothetical protein